MGPRDIIKKKKKKYNSCRTLESVTVKAALKPRVHKAMSKMRGKNLFYYY